ncbi:hypothetical protein F4821DRAFT_256851 [Hypoxylon rubiginosum]|uniref:Uncharacterized protein n=1 Tax=Hypoxylon rubiginosum TaxID=110542 RepID=A0ACC0D9Z1_9PEZI|nr:hypothetical protein F4821DRAFT_256851 [Hypoxylon rubiginosum]
MASLPSGSHTPNRDLHYKDDEMLFSAILDILADTDIFNHVTSSSVFVVYAHDNVKKGIANAECVHLILDWLGRIRSRTLSDKSPLSLWSTRREGSAAIQNIVDNQFCLIPARSNSDNTNTITSVDKVLVFGSGLLKRYCEDPFTSSYINAIKKSYSEGLAKSTDPQVLKEKVKRVVERNCHRSAFHHVLTELALVGLRKSKNHDNNHGIITITLHEDLMAYLPFNSPSDVVLKLKSPRRTDLHLLFFRLLRRIYKESHPLINRFEDCYKRSLRKLEGPERISRERLETIIYTEIHQGLEDLKRLDGAILRNEIHKSQLQSILFHLNEKVRAPVMNEKRRLLLRDLPTIPYLDRKNRNQDRTPGTCRWLKNHPLFQEFHHSKTSSLLWVSADPGCGKSVLAKYLVDQVLPTTATRTTCYFFFKDDYEDQRNLESAMRCLLHQIFIQKPALLTEKIMKRFDEDGKLFDSFAGLWDILTGVASHDDAGEIICILDALDECEERGRSRLVAALNELYDDEESQFSLKFLLTSRPYNYIRRDFLYLKKRRPTIHLSGENETEVDKISKEIDIVIGAKVKEIGAYLELDDEEEQVMREELNRFTHRTYLWVHLVFDVIRNSNEITKGQLRANIRKLPPTVEAAYEKILSRSCDIRKARDLLHIIIAARRPLSLKEMATALALSEVTEIHQLELEPDNRFRNTVRELCGLFVTIVDSKVYLLHQTAKEFLLYRPYRITSGSNTQRQVDTHYARLWYAAKGGNEGAVRQLLKKNAKLRSKSRTARERHLQ